MLRKLKDEVCRANLLLPKYGLVTFTWGNVSAIDRMRGLIVIKPSGVEYDKMKPEDMVIVDLDGNVVSGTLHPSSDAPTHIELYKAFDKIGAVVHTHSKWATSFAQAGRGLTPLGTTHADYFCGSVPITRPLSNAEIMVEYEKNTGLLIAETFATLDPYEVPAVLVNQHGAFCWGNSAAKAVENAVVLEEIAHMNYVTTQINSCVEPVSDELLSKHYFRKHGESAYYGQSGK